MKATGPDAVARSLSGGNQQKVILAREVDMGSEVIVFDQPTRGLDLGAIEHVHRTILDEKKKGKAIVLISTELSEIFALSDRIAVIYQGRDPRHLQESRPRHGEDRAVDGRLYAGTLARNEVSLRTVNTETSWSPTFWLCWRVWPSAGCCCSSWARTPWTAMGTLFGSLLPRQLYLCRCLCQGDAADVHGAGVRLYPSRPICSISGRKASSISAPSLRSAVPSSCRASCRALLVLVIAAVLTILFGGLWGGIDWLAEGEVQRQ